MSAPGCLLLVSLVTRLGTMPPSVLLYITLAGQLTSPPGSGHSLAPLAPCHPPESLLAQGKVLLSPCLL